MNAKIKLLVTCLFPVFFLGCQEVGEKEMPSSAQPRIELQECQRDSDCVLVEISCNGCCERDAVNKNDTAKYAEYKSKTCVGRSGGVCDCCFFSEQARCVEGLCKAKLIEETCTSR